MNLKFDEKAMHELQTGNGLIKVIGWPLEMIEACALQCKLLEPV